MKKRLFFLVNLVLTVTTLVFFINAHAAPTDKTPAGVINGDVLYKGKLEVSRIFDERRENTLGKPLNSRGPFHFYDGLEISYSSNTNPDNSITESADIILGTKPSLFSINGVTLDKKQAELIAALGKPIEYFKYTDL